MTTLVLSDNNDPVFDFLLDFLTFVGCIGLARKLGRLLTTNQKLGTQQVRNKPSAC